MNEFQRSQLSDALRALLLALDQETYEALKGPLRMFRDRLIIAEGDLPDDPTIKDLRELSLYLGAMQLEEPRRVDSIRQRIADLMQQLLPPGRVEAIA